MDNSEDSKESVDQIKNEVLQFLQHDLQAAEFSLAIFSAAILSYRKDTCLRPLPDFLDADSGEQRLEKLVSIFNNIPPLKKLPTSILSDDCWRLLKWILKNRQCSFKTAGKVKLEEIFQKTGESSFSLEPCQIFEVCYNTNMSKRFNDLKKEHGLKYGYHGSRLDNFYSIIQNGLQVHMMKNGIFGEGVYLTDDLAITMPYTKSGIVWDHTTLGEQVSCVAFCELIDHPGVKCQVENDTSKTRATAKNSESGEVPERYFVVTSSELVRIKYILVFSTKKSNKRSVKEPSICSQYPVLTILVVYLAFLLLMGFWKSRSFQMFYRKYFSGMNNDDKDDSFV